MFEPATNTWINMGAAGSYYQNYSFFGGHGNSVPIDTSNPSGSGGACLPAVCPGNSNHTDQFYGNGAVTPYSNFYDHSGSNIPWVGDHLVGFQQAQDQQTKITFNKSGNGVDEIAFRVLGRSDTQTNNQSAVQTQWNAAGGGTNAFGIMELLVTAYDNVDPTMGSVVGTYEILVGGTTPQFGTCLTARAAGGQGLNQAIPVPCNDAPVIDIQGIKGLFNIKSVVISSTTDALGFYIDELYYDQTGQVATPEPTQLLLIGGGLFGLGLLARRRSLFRR
ncbi:MAG TPA: PEP-CTERM sorting domain-containing protein [Candidatus Solibacter sp.]|nr:PEP-CTERM sorting domain-containing protein [Candidatus Solibacter sp.]